MPDNLYEDFVTHVTTGDLLWSCYKTEHCDSFSVINPRERLLIAFRLWHPRGPHPRVKREFWRDFRESFQIDKHVHWFDIKITDPAFRWGRKVIFEAEVWPHDLFYEFYRELYNRVRTTANIVSKERSFNSRLSGLKEAMEEITRPSTTNLPVF